jgi:hypothetical protein
MIKRAQMVQIDGDRQVFRTQGFLRQYDRVLRQRKRFSVLSGPLEVHHPFAEFENVVRLLGEGGDSEDEKKRPHTNLRGGGTANQE